MGMGGGEEAGEFLRPGCSRRGCSADTVTNHRSLRSLNLFVTERKS